MYTAEVQCDAETHAGRGGFLESLRQGPGPCMACPGSCGRQGRAVPWARPPPPTLEYKDTDFPFK